MGKATILTQNYTTLDYCSEVWGFKQFKQIEAIQHKAIRIFQGVHRHACTFTSN